MSSAGEEEAAGAKPAEVPTGEGSGVAAPVRRRLSRRKFIARLAVYGLPLLGLGEGLLEPGRLHIRRSRKGDRGKRIVHITDLHYKGGRGHLEAAVEAVNREKPDAVVCTGDFVEQSEWLPETLEILRGLKAPLFAVPGNHDYWSGASFADLAACCEATGGRWLADEDHLHDDWLALSGVTGTAFPKGTVDPFAGRDVARVLLCHYPIVGETIRERTFDLIVAGHSHGGQIRLPGIGPLLLPRHVGRYDLGWFDLPAGPLHVSAGVGTYFIPIRFLCCPDIAVIDL